jgi:predicted nucleic acid-binding protein
MAGLYVDTSALGRVLLAEPDAASIQASLAGYEESWSSSLLTLELGRLARRHGKTDFALQLLEGLSLCTVTEERLRVAAAIQPLEVRSLDAIHLGAAVELRDAELVSAVLTFDKQFIAGCVHHGIEVIKPA